jgi:phenazine biosynthesis protein phzE
MSDADYADTVAQIIQQEIGTGEGSNFVIARSLEGTILGYRDDVGLSVLRNLLTQERGAYWTFLVRTPELTLVGASPERHITLREGRVSMTPVSGTYRFPSSGPTLEGLLTFLSDRKEQEELSMVLDEELKMMTSICSEGVEARGPHLTMMAHLAHAGYEINGRTSLPVSQILVRSMFAPTVTGSPLVNATRVIYRRETKGRSYYSGYAALVSLDDGKPAVDSCILIRTAEITPGGRMRLGVGATIVRESDPATEAAETAAKAAALQRAFSTAKEAELVDDELVRKALRQRNDRFSTFWLRCGPAPSTSSVDSDSHPSVLIIDNEDAFTSMMEYQLRAMGITVRVLPSSAEVNSEPGEILVLGPGPGDPCDVSDSRVSNTRKLLEDAVARELPLLAVCLSHQILCAMLGCMIGTLSPPHQGLQRQVRFLGRTETVGFYNTYTALTESDDLPGVTGRVRVYRDDANGHVVGLRGPRFISMQFHPESVLTVDGPRVLRRSLEWVTRP